MGANDPQGGAIFDTRGMIGRIYLEHHITLLQVLGLVVTEKKIFSCFSYYKPMADVHALGCGQFGHQGHAIPKI